MKLLILSDAPIYRVEGEYYSQDTFPKFIGGLNKYFSAITMLSPVYDGRNGANLLYKLPCNDKGPIILGTSPVASVTEYYRRIIKILVYNIPIFCKALKESDAILTRSPAMNTFIFALLAIMYRKPVFCYFIGDEKSVIKSGTKYKGIKYYLALVISNIHNLLYRIIFSFAKASFFLSEDLRKKYVKNKDNSYFMFTSLIDDSDIEKKTEIGEIGLNPTILSVGRLSPEKGIQYLIRAMPIMSRQNIQARLLICGSGPSEEEYQARVKELGLEDQVRFLGFVSWGEELAAVYRQSDIFILPSLSEGVPKVLLEAMAKGVPIVATEVGGIPAVIKHMENGILVPLRNPEAIAEAVKLIIERETLRQKLIENGYRFVQEHTSQKQAKRIAEVVYKYIYKNQPIDCCSILD